LGGLLLEELKSEKLELEDYDLDELIEYILNDEEDLKKDLKKDI